MPMHERLGLFAAGLLGGMIALTANAADKVEAKPTYATLESLDPRFDALIPPDTKIEKIADDLLWSEGPLWDSAHEDAALLRHPAQSRHAVARR